MPDKDIRNTILHIYIKNQERAFATLLSPHYAVCSCKAVTLDNKFNVDGYGNLKDNGNAVAECIFVNKEYNFQVLKMAQQAPDSSISCIHHDFKGLTNPNSLLKTYWYSSRKKTFEELPAFTKNFGGYATHKEFIEISLSDEKGYFDITSTLGTPVLYQSGELVGIFADEPETKEGLFSIVPILDIIIVGRWFDDLVLSDYNNWKNKNDDTEQASSSASTTSSESTQRKNTAAKDYRKEYIEILRQCSETPNHEYLDEQAKYAYELKLGGYVTAAEILDNGHPVQVMVMNVTPSGREYLSRLEKEIAAQDIEISSRDESHSSNSGSSSEAIDDTDSDSASSDVTDGTTTEGVKIDPNPVVPGRPSDNEIESAKINVSRDEFTDSSFFILTNAFGLATVTGEGWGDEKHLLVEGLWVGITKETVIKNPYSSFTTLIEALGLETEDKLIDFLHDRKLLPDTTGLDILRFFNDGAVSQSPVNIPFSHNAIKIINRARDIAQETAKDKKAYQVHQRHLLTALVLSFKESTILNTAFSGFEQKIVAAIIKDISVHYSNLKSDDPSGWSKIRILVEAEFRSPGPKIPPGKNTSISRDARADETCLNAEAYVKVLKSLLKGVSGEFCMGLFAPWGRGKTYLIKLLSKSLENEKERNYQVIKFSAWKYRTIPSLWCHLFEEFRKGINRCNIIRYLTISVIFFFIKKKRSLICFFVATTILLAITLLFIFLSSSYSETIILFSFLWTKLKEWQIWISALPPIILILLQKLYGLKHQADRLIKKYANLPSYKNHLGIQELLEDDLRNLIIASTKGACFFKWTWPFSGKGFPKRFLLIVDDLDRCEPSEMLFVIENLMLLLNEKGIKERLHIILIMEEDVLCLALVEKYKQLIMLEKKLDSPAAVKYEEFIAHQIVDENIEKLIICYLRLNPLTPEEIEEAVIKFTNKDLPENKKLSMPSENTQNQSIGYSDIKASVNVTKPQSAALGGDKRNTEAELNNDDYVYSHVERRQILDYINEYGKRADKPWGPRAIRAFLFKYQLAKLLLREMGQPVDSTKIIDCFKKTKEKDKKHLDETGDIVRAVVEQVR